MARAVQLIYEDVPGTLPAEYVVPAGAGLTLQSIVAKFNGAGAAGTFLPCLSVFSQDGRLMGRFHDDEWCAAGDTAVVTYAPF